MNESISFPVCDEGSLQVRRLVVQQLEGITHPGCKIPALGQECTEMGCLFLLIDQISEKNQGAAICS